MLDKTDRCEILPQNVHRTPVTALKGIGPKTAAALEKLGISTAAELVRHYPCRFDFYPAPLDIASLADEDARSVAVSASLTAPLTVVRRGRFVLTTGTVSDGSGKVSVRWYNMPYLKKTLRAGETRIFVGKLRKKGQSLLMEQPSVFSISDYRARMERPVPVYALTEGVSNRLLTQAIRQALSLLGSQEDWLPEALRTRYALMEEGAAIREIHDPENMESFRAARKRIVFNEFFSFLQKVRKLKERSAAQSSVFQMQTTDALRECRTFFPFQLTSAQEKAVCEIAADLESGIVMNRLIQGDVGSGKTAVAAAALYTAFRSGWQSAIMVPTEVLARQHRKTLEALFEKAEKKPRLLLLTGSLKPAEKRAAHTAIHSHEADIIIGTHALIQEAVSFDCLALVVTDEQHRFGVMQRGSFARKGPHPHMLVMSATPIPRTLAVILYGDLDISTIDFRPSGRMPIKNAVIRRADRPRALLHIRREIEAGHQAYIICPLVEESELSDAENVVDYSQRLAESFRGIARVACLHGRMKEAEKRQIMEEFSAHKTDILVSTTVVEVGVDVPNATVMMIENAEQFGLASLHQLRGRVGRGAAQSYCIFVQGKKSTRAKERLELLARSNDGFEIAAADLKMRGPGELFGALQSGELTLGLGDIYNDYSILQTAREISGLSPEWQLDGASLQKEVIL
ncbi:MAG: ATP-dependent DNA helicase RecG [Stomatobaculum sp.]